MTDGDTDEVVNDDDDDIVAVAVAHVIATVLVTLLLFSLLTEAIFDAVVVVDNLESLPDTDDVVPATAADAVATPTNFDDGFEVVVLAFLSDTDEATIEDALLVVRLLLVRDVT